MNSIKINKGFKVATFESECIDDLDNAVTHFVTRKAKKLHDLQYSHTVEISKEVAFKLSIAPKTTYIARIIYDV